MTGSLEMREMDSRVRGNDERGRENVEGPETPEGDCLCQRGPGIQNPQERMNAGNRSETAVGQAPVLEATGSHTQIRYRCVPLHCTHPCVLTSRYDGPDETGLGSTGSGSRSDCLIYFKAGASIHLSDYGIIRHLEV